MSVEYPPVPAATLHDLGNLLVAIRCYGEFALERANGDDQLRSDLEELLRAADSAVGLIREARRP